MSEGLRVIIYIRVSTLKQVNEGYGLKTQEERCRALAIAKGWVVVDVVDDGGISGTLDETNGRVGLKKIFTEADKKTFDLLLFFSLDRLGRTSAIVLSTIDSLVKKKIMIASCKESIDTSTPTGVFVLTIFAGLAQLERDNIVERLANGKKHRKEKVDGECGGDLIWGYKRFEKKIVVDEYQAKIINYIYSLYYGKQLYFRAITEQLNKEKIPSPKGKVWHVNTVTNILKKHNDSYRGGPRNRTSFNWPVLLNKEYLFEKKKSDDDDDDDNEEKDDDDGDDDDNEEKDDDDEDEDEEDEDEDDDDEDEDGGEDEGEDEVSEE